MMCDSNQSPLVEAELKINGDKIALNNFIENFISQAVIGMVKSLRGVDSIETIELKISTKSEKPQKQ